MKIFKMQLEGVTDLEDRKTVEPLINEEVYDFGRFLSSQNPIPTEARGEVPLGREPDPIHPLEAQIVKTYLIWKLRKEGRTNGS